MNEAVLNPYPKGYFTSQQAKDTLRDFGKFDEQLNKLAKHARESMLVVTGEGHDFVYIMYWLVYNTDKPKFIHHLAYDCISGGMVRALAEIVVSRYKGMEGTHKERYVKRKLLDGFLIRLGSMALTS